MHGYLLKFTRSCFVITQYNSYVFIAYKKSKIKVASVVISSHPAHITSLAILIAIDMPFYLSLIFASIALKYFMHTPNG